MFGDYQKMGVTGADRVYESVNDLKKLQKTLENYMDSYNMESHTGVQTQFYKILSDTGTKFGVLYGCNSTLVKNCQNNSNS